MPLYSYLTHMTTKYTVQIIRGPLETRTWEHETKSSAQSRAHALCQLHSVAEATYNDCTFTFTVDASAYYAGAKPIDPNAPRPSRRKV